MTSESQPAPRDTSIDLARGVAVFGVILIHCAPGTPAAAWISDFFLNVCVPFFLLTSLYFFWREVDRTGNPTEALFRRLPRLLVPYAAWTAIYVLARVAKLLLRHGSVAELFTPASLTAIIGSGGAALQLYFLPCLMLALVIAWAVSLLLQQSEKAQRFWLGGLLLLTAPSLFLRFDGYIQPDWSPVAKLGLTYLDWAIWTLPIGLVGAAFVVFRRRRVTAVTARLGWWLLGVAALLDVAIVSRITPYLWRVHSLLLAALVLGGCLLIGVSAGFSERFGRVAKVSFGIFLVHHLFIELIELLDATHGATMTRPYTVVSLLSVGVVVLALSAAFSLWVRRSAWLSRILFGS